MSLLSDIEAGIARATNTLASIQAAATPLIQSAVSAVGNFFTAPGDSHPVSTVTKATDAISAGFQSASQTSFDPIQAALQKMARDTANIAGVSGSQISAGLAQTAAQFQASKDAVNASLVPALADTASWLDKLKTEIGNVIEDTINGIEGAFERFIEPILSPIITGLENIGKFLLELPGDIFTIGKEIVEALEKIPHELAVGFDAAGKARRFEEIVKSLSEIPADIIHPVKKAINALLMPALRELFGAAGFDARALSGEAVDRIIEMAVAQQGVQMFEEALGAQGFIIANLIDRVSDPLLSGAFRELEYAGNVTQPNKLVDVSTLLVLFHRGVIGLEDVKEDLAKDGFDGDAVNRIVAASYRLNGIGELAQSYFRGLLDTPETFIKRAEKLGYAKQDISEFLELSRPLLGSGEAITMWRRDIVPEGDTDAFGDMRREGYTEARINAIKAASFTLPSIFNVQDFKVRHVDDPAIVDKFKLDAFIDEDYFASARRLGYSEKDARRMYRFYWELPPFFQTSRMFSTGKIPEQDFRDMLSFMRFTPYWVDKLTDDLKPRLTASEVREKYKYQIISADQIVPELLKLSIPEELAREHAAIWVASVKLANPLDATAANASILKTQGLTLSLILTAYKDGVETKDEATRLMGEIGIGPEEAVLHIKIADYEAHKELVTVELANIKANVGAGLLSVHDAVVELQSLGITALQIDRYSAELTKMTQHKPKIPTLAEFTAWLKHGIITLNEYAEALALLGYADDWIPFYLSASGATPDQILGLGYSKIALG